MSWETTKKPFPTVYTALRSPWRGQENWRFSFFSENGTILRGLRNLAFFLRSYVDLSRRFLSDQWSQDFLFGKLVSFRSPRSGDSKASLISGGPIYPARQPNFFFRPVLAWRPGKEVVLVKFWCVKLYSPKLCIPGPMGLKINPSKNFRLPWSGSGVPLKISSVVHRECFQRKSGTFQKLIWNRVVPNLYII